MVQCFFHPLSLMLATDLYYTKYVFFPIISLSSSSGLVSSMNAELCQKSFVNLLKESWDFYL